VKIAEINSQARAAMWEEQGPIGQVQLRNQLIARPSVIGKLGTPVAPLANWALGNRTLRGLAHSLIGIHRDAPMPKFAGRTFQRWARRHPRRTGEKTVVYFHGCGTNYYEPRAGEMLVAVLEHNGFNVVIPPQDCCGLPLQSNGRFPAARGYVRRLVANLAPYAHEGIPIVANSTSCGLMLKREAHEILGIEDEDLQVVSKQLFDVCEFLLLLHEKGELRTDFQPLPLEVPYHAPCQQRGHGIGKPALDLLALVPELRVIELNIDCCGIAGTYGLKKEKYDISMAVGEQLFREIRDAKAEVAACDSETCRWQIEHGTGVHAVHPIELLYRGYGLDSHSPAPRERVAERVAKERP
jgi:glycerol-3-phosphate dehydrogenase subunit C